MKISEFIDELNLILTDIETDKTLNQKELMNLILKKLKKAFTSKSEKEYRIKVNKLIRRLKSIKSAREFAIAEINEKLEIFENTSEMQIWRLDYFHFDVDFTGKLIDYYLTKDIAEKWEAFHMKINPRQINMLWRTEIHPIKVITKYPIYSKENKKEVIQK